MRAAFGKNPIHSPPRDKCVALARSGERREQI
jgi:hypothetical protein